MTTATLVSEDKSSVSDSQPLESSLRASFLPPTPSFSGHQTFSMRSGWLKKGLDAIQSEGSAIFAKEEALVALGVGKNMVQSIRYWLLTSGMAYEPAPDKQSKQQRGRDIQPTPLALALFGGPDGSGWDPYLEDDGTLWLLHALLTGPGGSSLTWAFSFSLFRQYEFTADSLTDAIFTATARIGQKVSARETVMRDVECFLHTYARGRTSSTALAGDEEIDSPLLGLDLIRAVHNEASSGGRRYRFLIGPKMTLPPAVFHYALLRFWKWRQEGATARPLTVWDVLYAEGSPGMIFKLDEDTVLGYLDTLEAMTRGAYRFEDSVQTRQVVCERPNESTEWDLLRGYYGD